MLVTVPTGSRLPISPRRSSARHLLLGQPFATSQPDPSDRRASGASPRRLPHWVRSLPLRAAQQACGRRARARAARLHASGRRPPAVQRVGGLARWQPFDSQHAHLLTAAGAPNLRADRPVLCACAGLSRKALSRVRRVSRVLASLHARSGHAPTVPSSRELEPAVSCSRTRLSEQVRQSLARPLAPPPP